MATFLDLYSEVIGTIPNIPPPLAQKYVNRSFLQICNMRLWSWLVAIGDITVPELISTGTVSVTTGSPIVTLSPEALSALLPQALANPPLASPTLGIGRQFRIRGSTLSSPIYNIIGFSDSSSTLLLDRPYTGPSATSAAYHVYKCYYAPPTTDFLRYIVVSNMSAGYTISQKRLHVSQEFLSRIDPQRGTTGDTYHIANYRSAITPLTSDASPVHEFYPHPTHLSVYNCVYTRRFLNLDQNTDLPSTLPDSLIISRALVHAGNWAMSNIVQYPELSQTNWVQYTSNKMTDFKAELIQAIKIDDDIQPLLPFTQTQRRGFPLGGEYLQSHDVSSLFDGNW